MKFKFFLTILFSFLFQLSISQNSGESKYEEAKEAFYLENYDEASSLIKEAKKSMTNLKILILKKN